MEWLRWSGSDGLSGFDGVAPLAGLSGMIITRLSADTANTGPRAGGGACLPLLPRIPACGRLVDPALIDQLLLEYTEGARHAFGWFASNHPYPRDAAARLVAGEDDPNRCQRKESPRARAPPFRFSEGAISFTLAPSTRRRPN